MKFESSVCIRKQFLFAACANICHILIGYTVAWTAPVIPKLQDLDQSPLQELISLSQASWLGSGYLIGGIIGPLLLAKMSNTTGRKPCLMLAAAISILGYIMLLFAKNFATLLAGRVVIGVSTGTMGVINLVYIGEISSPNIRGILLSSTAIFHTFGVLLIYSAGPFISFQWIEYVFFIICGFYILGLLCIPESPLYYILKDNKTAAASTLEKLGRGKDIEKELKNICDDAAEFTKSKFNIKEVFTIKSNRKSLLITSALYIFQECSGLLAIANFLMTIFQKAGTSVEPALATVIIGITQFVVTLIAPIFIDYLGRKTLLLVSTAGCAICMAVMGIYFYLDFISCTPINSVGWLPLVVMVFTYCAYGIGLNIVPNTLLAEMYRPNVRSIGTSISMALGWTAGIVSILCFGYIVQALGPYVVFCLYAVVNVVAFIFICFVVPETKRLSLTYCL